MSTQSPSTPERSDFIRDIVAADLRAGRHESVATGSARAQRLPPHRAREVDLLELRYRRGVRRSRSPAFDDTNPVKEEQEYIDSIETDVRWLGFDWGEHLDHASDYFERLYEWAVEFIKAGKADVDI